MGGQTVAYSARSPYMLSRAENRSSHFCNCFFSNVRCKRLLVSFCHCASVLITAEVQRVILCVSKCFQLFVTTSLTSIDQSQPSAADRDSVPLLMATSLSPLSHTLAPVHLLWRVLRPGTNCRCTHEHGRQLPLSGRHQIHMSSLPSLSPVCPGTPHRCNDCPLMLRCVRNCWRQGWNCLGG